MVDPINVKNVFSMGRAGAGSQVPAVKKDPGFPVVQPTGSADVVQISSDAALKSKLSAFAATLYKEMGDIADPVRMAQLKEKYAGDKCPVSSADIADAVIARIRIEGIGDE